MKSKFNIGCSEVLEAAPILTLILKVMTSLALFALPLEESRWFLAGRVQQPALEERSQSQAGLGAAVAVSAQAQLRAGQGKGKLDSRGSGAVSSRAPAAGEGHMWPNLDCHFCILFSTSGIISRPFP